MAKSDVETSRIYDGVRGSKILRDALSKIDQKIDTFALEMSQQLFELGQDFRNTRQRVHGTERDFPRKADEQHHSRYGGSTSNFDEIECWFHEYMKKEASFLGIHQANNTAEESIVVRFKRNLPVFDGFWHPEDLTSWIDSIEDFFDEINPPEHLKCKIVWYKMKGAAYYWWKTLQNDLFSEGKSLISWPIMKGLLRKRFMPTTCSTKDIEIEAITTESSNKDDEFSAEEQPIEMVEVTHPKCLTECPNKLNKQCCYSKNELNYQSSVSGDTCKAVTCENYQSDPLGHDATIDDKDTQVGKTNEETEKDLQLETSKKCVMNDVDSLIIPTREITFELSIAKGSEVGGSEMKVECQVLSILHEPLKYIWTYQLSLERNPYLQGCWRSTSAGAESTRGSLRTKKHAVEFLLLPAIFDAYYDVDVFLFDPGGNIHLSSSMGFEIYFLSCSNRLNSNGFFNLLENEVTLMLLKRFSNEKDKEMVAPIISEKLNTSSSPACIFVIDNGIFAWDASSMVFYVHEADGILIGKIQKLIRPNVDSQVNGFTYRINDLEFVKETYTITWGLFVRFGGGWSSFSDDNKNPTRFLGGMFMVSLNAVTKLVLLLFDPGGVSSIMGNFSNYFSLSFNILDCIILRIDMAVEILSLRNSSVFTGYCFGNGDWHSNLMLKDKIAVKIVFCSFVWLGNSCDSLASFMMVISVLFRSRKESVLMDWTERGWFCKIEWNGGETVEYEFVIVGKNGHLTSEHADIRKWLILENNRHFEVDCQWNLTREALDLVPLEQSEAEHGDVEFAVFDDNITSGIISSTAVDQWDGKAVSFVSSKEQHDRERKRMWDTYGLRDVVLFGPHGLLYVRCPQILTHTDSPYTFLVDFWSVLKSDMPLKVLRYHDFAHLVDRSLHPLYTEDVFSSVCRFDLSIEGLFTCCSHMPQDVVCFMKDQKQRMVCHVAGICNYLYMTTFYSYMLPRLTCRQQCITFVALLFMVEGKTSLMLWVLIFKLRLHVTLGRAILEAGWDVKNRSNKLNMAQRSVVTISSCLNVLCTNRRLREYLTLFYKVVNGLDPPMNLIGTFFRSFNVADLTMFKAPDQAPTLEESLEDEFILLGEDGDNVVN